MNLYIITNGKHVKIGVSADVAKRLSTLQVGNPDQLWTVYQLNCGSNEYAYKLEALLHKRYEKAKVKGEWFAVPQAVLKMDFELMEAGAEIFTYGVHYAEAEDKVLSGMTKEQILEYVEDRWPTPVMEETAIEVITIALLKPMRYVKETWDSYTEEDRENTWRGILGRTDYMISNQELDMLGAYCAVTSIHRVSRSKLCAALRTYYSNKATSRNQFLSRIQGFK